MKAVLSLIGGIVVLVLSVIVVRTLMFTPIDVVREPVISVEVDAEEITARMAEAIRFRTVSVGVDQTPDYGPFTAFTAWVKQNYPRVQQDLSLQMVADHTMLYRWEGRNAELKPILLTAHYDVVPVVPGSENDWVHPPFAGEVADGYVWGRGSMDDKSGVIVMLEATTLLLKEGFRPERTVYFSYSHDEERGGITGAKGVTERLESRGVQLIPSNEKV